MAFTDSITVKIGADTSGFRKGMGGVVSTTRAASQKIGRNFTKMTRQVTQAGIALTATVGVATGLALKSASDYRKELGQIAAVTDEPIAQIRALGEEQKELSASFGSDIVKQLGATYDALSAQVTSVANATKFATIANEAAIAGNSDVRTSAEGIIRMLKAFGSETFGASQAADTLFTIIKKGTTTMDALAPNVGRAAKVFDAAGIKVNEFAAALIVATGTASTPEAIVQITQLVSAFLKPAQSASEKAELLGFGLDASQLAARGLGATMESLRKIVGGAARQELSDMIQAGTDVAIVQNQMAATTGLATSTIAKLFPSIRALRGALALTANQGTEFARALGDTADMSGNATTAYERAEEIGGRAFDKISAKVKILAIDMGEAMMPALESAFESLSEFIGGIRDWIKENKPLAKQIGEWAIKLTAVSVVILPMALVLGGVASAIGAVASAIGVILPILGFLGKALLFLTLNPIGAFVAAVAFLTFMIIRNWDWIKAAWDTGVTFVGDLLTDLGKIFVIVWEGVASAWTSFWTAFSAIFKGAWNGISAFFKGLWTGVSDFFGGIWAGIKEAFQASVNFIQSVWNAVGGAISGAWEATWSGVKSFFGGIMDWIMAKWEAVVNFIKTLWENVSGFFADVGAFFTETIPEFLGFHGGGQVGGPAGGRDNVPIMAERGEFVVNAESTSRHLDLLRALNADRGGDIDSSMTIHGGLQVSFPNIRTERDARGLISEFDRIRSRGQDKRHRRGLR